MSQSLTLAVRPDGVAVLTFDQPGSRANVLTRELWAEFGDALAQLAPRTDLKGLVLASAKPGVFIAGADLKLLANAPAPNDPDVRAFIEQGLRVLEQLEALPFPTCAAIDGAALGGGLEVALACDFRVCGTNPKVQLGLPEVKLGLIPGWGGTQRLPRAAGMVPAVTMMLTGEPLTAARADECGLAQHAPSEGLLDWAAGRVLTSAQKGQEPWPRDLNRAPHVFPLDRTTVPEPTTTAGRAALDAVTEGTRLPVRDGIALETEAFMRLAGSDESKRLIAEFFARKK